MATVFAAVQEGPHGFENEVAIKLVHPHLLREHPHVVRMVVDEARVASRIRHPHVVRIMDLCEEPPDVLYIVMDYVDGVSMRQVLDTARAMKNRPPLAPVLEVLAAACDGLHAAHGATQPDGTPLNLVHRDVKPGNILVSSDGEVKVGDFGIAFFGDRLVESTAHGQMKGTPAYMSPEQVLGTPVDARSDIFSMGLTLYTLTTAKLAFGGESPMGMAMKIAHESLEPHAEELDEICLGLGDILRTACAKEPMARYPQAAAMGTELRALRDGLRGKATIAEMVVASGWRPRAADERPGEMASIDGKGTVVDVGPIGRGPEIVTTPEETGAPPIEVTIAEDRPGLEATEDTDSSGVRPAVEEPTTNEAPAPVEPELLPPDPYARPVMPGRGAPRVEVTGSRPRVFADPAARPPPERPPGRPPGPPPRPPGRPPPSGSVPRPPGARGPGRPPGPPPNPRRPPKVLERDYRGRVIQREPEAEESAGIGIVEKLGVAVAFVMVLVAVVVIVNRAPTPDPFAEDEPAAVASPEEEEPVEATPADAAQAFADTADSAVAAPEELPPEPPEARPEPTPEARPAPTPAPKVARPTPAPKVARPTPAPKVARPTPTPAPVVSGTGLLTVNSYPWAEVHLDGRRIGNTPVIERTIDAGSHTVKLIFKEPGLDGEVPEAIEKAIDVEGGEHEKVVHRGK